MTPCNSNVRANSANSKDEVTQNSFREQHLLVLVVWVSVESALHICIYVSIFIYLVRSRAAANGLHRLGIAIMSQAVILEHAD